MTRDIGIGAPGVFTGALAGDIGPFLRSAIATPRGRARRIPGETNPETLAIECFVGDPNNPVGEPVIGGPNGNILRIQGPNGLDVSTDRFFVTGRLWNNVQPTPLTVDRATYLRTAADTRLEVFATSLADATLSFRQAIVGLESPMTGTVRAASSPRS